MTNGKMTHLDPPSRWGKIKVGVNRMRFPFTSAPAYRQAGSPTGGEGITELFSM